jgi:SAM-dependent methyltransferase
MQSVLKSVVSPDVQDRVNRRVYHQQGVERSYFHDDRLTRAEAMALLKHSDALRGLDVLDIGIGTGRTTAYLAPLARSYLGIDYSPVMVEYCQARLPQGLVRLGDMRQLDGVGDGSLDLVFGSNCVIDAVSHVDRLRTLREWRRVLRVGGRVIFSAHNRAHTQAQDPPRLAFSRNPVTQLANVSRWAQQRLNRRRHQALHRDEPDYALLTDAGHDYSCLHYYVLPEVQCRQLRAEGFEVVDMLDRAGVSLAPGETSPHSPWVMYVARAVPLSGRPGAPSVF